MSIIRNFNSNIVGSVIKFGDYDWRVLDVQNDKALLLSDKVIEIRAFHSTFDEITWAECELRGYLNSAFLDSFGANDKSRVIETRIVTNNNPWYGTNGGKITKDRLFLLSIEEVVQYFGDSGRLADGPPEDDDFIGCIDDQYSFSRIAFDKSGNDSCWWLRSPGKYNSYATVVNGEGEISIHGPYTDNVFVFGAGVRPALWLNL